MEKYLYRGNEEGPFVDELRERLITGSGQNVCRGSLAIPPSGSPEGDDLADLEWFQLSSETAAVTGGVTDDLVQTSRFSGGENYAMVLHGSSLPFEQIQYEYSWFNQHPGALAHVAGHSDGEVRVKKNDSDSRGDLKGLVERVPMVSGDDRTRIRDWGGPEGLPATGRNTRFADESEWLAFQESVPLTGSVEGVVSWKKPLGVRVQYVRDKEGMAPKDAPDWDTILPEVYDMLSEPLPDWANYYFLVADTGDNTEGGFLPEDIKGAYRWDGWIEPEDVPPWFRGVA